LAQFPEKQSGSVQLHCILCDRATEVERVDCTNSACLADAIYNGVCLTCLADQDDPRLLVQDPPTDAADTARYSFKFSRGRHGRGGTVSTDLRDFPNDEAAREHGRSALVSAHLQNWETVTIEEENPLASLRLLDGTQDRLIGTWIREDRDLVWKPGFVPDFYGFASGSKQATGE